MWFFQKQLFKCVYCKDETQNETLPAYRKYYSEKCNKLFIVISHYDKNMDYLFIIGSNCQNKKTTEKTKSFLKLLCINSNRAVQLKFTYTIDEKDKPFI